MRRVILVVVLCLPLLLRGQQPTDAAPAPPNGVARAFLSFGPPYGGWLLMAFDSIPANRYDFRPTPAQQSIGQIAQHLETANYGL